MGHLSRLSLCVLIAVMLAIVLCRCARALRPPALLSPPPLSSQFAAASVVHMGHMRSLMHAG